MKCLDYEFAPKCPKCGKDDNVERFLDSTMLVCCKCYIHFKIDEDKSVTFLWSKD